MVTAYCVVSGVAETFQVEQDVIRAATVNSGVEMKFSIAGIITCKNLFREHIFAVMWIQE